jgi:hypothetical protein
MVFIQGFEGYYRADQVAARAAARAAAAADAERRFDHAYR